LTYTRSQKSVSLMKRVLLTMLLSLLFIAYAAAQDRTISGKVTDGQDGSPLPGVNVIVEGTTKGTTTDVDGNYTMTLAEGENSLVFTFVGYKAATVSVGDQTTINVAMEGDVTSLEEVVVVGYGTQEQRDLTSAITTLKTEEINRTPAGQAMQSLQGRVAGVQIVSRGEPGEAPTVRVRGVGSLQGKSDPLYVVDGMFFENINFLNPADIATMTILKDASAAAIYGVRAANGVVLIETKSGSYDQAPQISYSGYYGVQVPQNVLKMANSEQFARYVNETGSTADMAFLDAAFQRFGRSRLNASVPAVNTDWYDEVLQSAPIQNHSLSIDGGGKGARYSVGASYFNQDGLLKHTRNGFERVNFRSKVDFDATQWLKVGGNVNISNGTRYVADNAVWFNTYFAVPVLPAYDPLNTTATPFQLGNARQLGYRNPQNPLFNLLYNDDRFRITQVLGNFHAEATIIPDRLRFRTAYNYNFGSTNERSVDLPHNTGLTPIQSGIRKSNTSTLNQIWDNVLTYTQSFDAHNLEVMAGYSYRDESSDLVFVRGNNLTTAPERGSEQYWYLTGRSTIDPQASGDWDATNTTLGRFYGTSYFGRISYNYDDRYLLYGTFRRDGTSKFQKKWGNFPTIGAGWVISEEEFFDFGFVDFLKLRASWGKLGNDTSPAAVGVPTLGGTETIIGGQRVVGSQAVVYYDLLTEWETTEETNVGLSSNFLNNRLNVEADYYIRDTENAALTIILPLTRDDIRRNRGVIRNSGFELAATWSDSFESGLSYSIGGNLATLKNEVRSLGGQPYLDAGQAEFRQRSIVGEPLEAFFGYEVSGVFQNEAEVNGSGYTSEFIAEKGLVAGDFNYKDQNGDGVIDDQDRVVLGSFLPSLNYGFNLGVTFKGVSLNALFQGQNGHSILNRKRGEIIFTTDTNIDADLASNLWRGEGTSDIYPSAAGIRKGWNQAMSDYFVEDGSYFRIQNVRLAYTLTNKEVFGVNFPETSVSFTAERPLTVFNYNGFNPEVPNGIDRQTYPIPAIYTVGLNIRL
jgi:TonB-dependent starch-binding outer membrane protein SusC